jgi:structure-specific endonuclease subunit SLX1
MDHGKSGGSTYIGSTIDLDRRLKQHNKLLSGGARATGIQVERGESWDRVCHVKNFPDWTACLQFEYRWKQLSRKYPLKMNPVERRLRALKDLLALERPTTKSIPYSEWPVPPEIVLEAETVVSPQKPTLYIIYNEICQQLLSMQKP